MRLSSLTILPMAPDHVPAAQALSTAVGWPYRVEDWAFVLGFGRGLVALDGETLVGTAVWCPLGAEAATLGMVIVAPDRQGRGLGQRLMDAALAEAGTRTVLLNATKEGLPLYLKMGFEPIGAVCQHQGTTLATAPAQPPKGTLLRSLQAIDLDAVIALDREACGLERTAMLRALAAAGVGLVFVVEGRMRGYAFYRRFGRGHVIGPVVAPGDEAAKLLIGTWIASHGTGFLRIDVPLASGLSGWLEAGGLPKVSEVVTMARGAPPATNSDSPRLFALASQSLG
ncbi:MAG: GNAT family N-acetyltransferase [Kiloniellales bacterium]